LDCLAKCHPYNALWAQLGDLKGALGHPLRVARTILTGKQSDVLNRLVRTLSYFIRCGSVSRNFEEKTEVGLPLSGSTKTLKGSDMSTCTLVPQTQQPAGLRRNQSSVAPPNTALSDLDLISDKVSRLCRVPAEAIMWHVNNLSGPQPRKAEDVRQHSAPPEEQSKQGVKFVVGDDESLDVGRKSEFNIKSKESVNEVTI
jgi:hypothetical protein